jgi:hypothetical protein
MASYGAAPFHRSLEVFLSYMSCPRCALSIRIRASWLVMERCPRCLARHGTVVELEEHVEPPRIRSRRDAGKRTAGQPAVRQATVRKAAVGEGTT